MFEYEIINIHTNERTFIYGYSQKDAWSRRPKLNPEDWKVLHSEYID